MSYKNDDIRAYQRDELLLKKEIEELEAEVERLREDNKHPLDSICMLELKSCKAEVEKLNALLDFQDENNESLSRALDDSPGYTKMVDRIDELEAEVEKQTIRADAFRQTAEINLADVKRLQEAHAFVVRVSQEAAREIATLRARRARSVELSGEERGHLLRCMDLATWQLEGDQTARDALIAKLREEGIDLKSDAANAFNPPLDPPEEE